MRILSTASLLLAIALSASHATAQDVSHGKDDYKLCASCHGFDAAGSQLVNAPALAGQEAWYLERQLRNFREGIRGSSDGDTHGQAMALMTRGLESDETIMDIVAYIGTLPSADPAVTIDGDTVKGRESYETCAACHGVNAEGNALLNAPALTTLDDWYQLRQLQAFKDGLRGAHPDDIYGQQMRPMASILADDAAMRSVVAYIASIR
ncbi:MAG: c-type cytochrome [Gammaproteobacteria bacterium]|nr:c-type cytochrome [Gammaproteobacteria bacterium]